MNTDFTELDHGSKNGLLVMITGVGTDLFQLQFLSTPIFLFSRCYGATVKYANPVLHVPPPRAASCSCGIRNLHSQ